jgi:hypothetical protein
MIIPTPAIPVRSITATRNIGSPLVPVVRFERSEGLYSIIGQFVYSVLENSIIENGKDSLCMVRHGSSVH